MIINSPVDTIGVSSVTSTRSRCFGSSSCQSNGSGSIEISQAGSFLGNLERLKSQDPKKMKEILGELANDLQSAADTSSGSEQHFLSKLADKFKEASMTGDLSGLHANQGHAHRFHPRDRVENAYQDSNTQSVAMTMNNPQETPATKINTASLQEIFSKVSMEVNSALAA